MCEQLCKFLFACLSNIDNWRNILNRNRKTNLYDFVYFRQPTEITEKGPIIFIVNFQGKHFQKMLNVTLNKS